MKEKRRNKRRKGKETAASFGFSCKRCSAYQLRVHEMKWSLKMVLGA